MLNGCLSDSRYIYICVYILCFSFPPWAGGLPPSRPPGLGGGCRPPSSLGMRFGGRQPPNPGNLGGGSTPTQGEMKNNIKYRLNANHETAAVTTTRSTYKIEDPSRGPGRVHLRALDAGFCLEAVPEPKIRRDPSPPKRKPYMWAAAVNRRFWGSKRQPPIGKPLEKVRGEAPHLSR